MFSTGTAIRKAVYWLELICVYMCTAILLTALWPVPDPEPVADLQVANTHLSSQDLVMVNLKEYIPSLHIDMRYAGENNIVGRPIYNSPHAYLRLGTAKKLGLVNIKDDLFRPDEPITREDMMVFTASVLNFSNGYIHHGTIEDLNQYTDVDSISPEAVESVAILVKEGIIEGNNNELFPKNYLTRAEAATVLYRMYNKLWGNLDN